MTQKCKLLLGTKSWETHDVKVLDEISIEVMSFTFDLPAQSPGTKTFERKGRSEHGYP